MISAIQKTGSRACGHSQTHIRKPRSVRRTPCKIRNSLSRWHQEPAQTGHVG